MPSHKLAASVWARPAPTEPPPLSSYAQGAHCASCRTRRRPSRWRLGALPATLTNTISFSQTVRFSSLSMKPEGMGLHQGCLRPPLHASVLLGPPGAGDRPLAGSTGPKPTHACVRVLGRELEAEVQHRPAPLIEVAEVHAAGPLVRSLMNSAISSAIL